MICIKPVIVRTVFRTKLYSKLIIVSSKQGSMNLEFASIKEEEILKLAQDLKLVLQQDTGPGCLVLTLKYERLGDQ